MKKLFLLSLSLFFIYEMASAQLESIVFFGKKERGAFYAESVTSDKDGNSYILGRINKDFTLKWKLYRMDFSPLNESLDYYIIKLDKDFSILWCKLYGGIGQEREGKIAADLDGNIYLAGCYYTGWEISTTNGNVLLPSNKVHPMLFLAKLDKNGDYIWAKSIHNSIGGNVHSLTVTPKNEALICGNLYTTNTPKSKIPIEVPAGGKDNGYVSFIYTYAGDGTQTSKIYNHNREFAYNMGVTLDLKNNYYYFTDFTDTSAAIINNPNYNAQSNIRVSTTGKIHKIGALGKTIWQTEIGKQKGNERRGIFINSIAVDEKENVYFCAKFLDSVQSGFANKKTNISNGANDILFGKLNSKGDILWQKSIGSAGYDVPETITYLQDSKKILIGGSYSGVIPAETLPNQKELPKPNGGKNIFLLEADTDGNVTGIMPFQSNYFNNYNSLHYSTEAGLIVVASLRDEQAAGIYRVSPPTAAVNTLPKTNSNENEKPQASTANTGNGDYEKANTAFKEKNYTEAFIWFQKSAAKEHTESCYMLGHLYYWGMGTKQNYNEARKWYKKAADKGHEKAATMITSIDEGF